jgi:Membrane-fusion protein
MFVLLPIRKTYSACFKEYESSADAHTRSYSVVLTMPQVDEFSALPGMAVTVSLDLSSLISDDAYARGMLVPLSAVFEEAEKTWVWKLNAAMQVEKTVVIVNRIENDQVLVEEGVSEGDLIVAVGVNFLQEGQAVKPLLKERGL